jgi:ribonuclease E
VEAVAEPVIEEPAPAPAAAVEETIVEQPAVEAAPEPIIEEPVPTPEAAVIEQPAEVVVEAEKVETAPEPIIEEAAAVVEEAVVEEAAPVVEAEVVQPEIVDAQVPPIVEEIMTANPSKAPVAAQIEAAAETVPEVSAETQPISTTTSAKEVLPVIESPTDSSEDKEA